MPYESVIPRDWTAVRMPFMSITSRRTQVISGVLQGERVLARRTSGPLSRILCPGVNVGTGLTTQVGKVGI